MEPAWVSVAVGVAGFTITAVGGLVSLVIALKKAEASAVKRNTELERTLTTQLTTQTQYLTKEIHEMREKFTSELAVMKRDMEHGNAEFQRLHANDGKLEERLRQVELEFERHKVRTATIKAG